MSDEMRIVHLRVGTGGPSDDTACGGEICRLGPGGRATFDLVKVTCPECLAAPEVAQGRGA